MKGNALYSALLRGIYAVPSEADGKFLGELAAPWRETVYTWDDDLRVWVRNAEGTLATFPASQAAAIRSRIVWAEEAIEEELEIWRDEHYGSVDEELYSDGVIEYVEELEQEIEELEKELAAL